MNNNLKQEILVAAAALEIASEDDHEDCPLPLDEFEDFARKVTEWSHDVSPDETIEDVMEMITEGDKIMLSRSCIISYCAHFLEGLATTDE